MNTRYATIASAIALATLSFTALPVRAQHAGHDMGSMNAPGAQLVEGEVRAIDTKAHKVTLKHGEMAGMPAMTMVYPYKADIALPANLRQGDKVRFRVDDVGGVMTVTQIVR